MTRTLVLVLAGSLAAGCFVGAESSQRPDEDANQSSGGNGAAAGGGSSGSSGSAACGSTESGMPAAVEAMLGARCLGCHGADPQSPMSLTSYEDLVAEAPSDASRSVAELVLERITSEDKPMPPGNGISVPAVEIEAFRSWLEAGLPLADAAPCEDPPGAGDGGTPPANEEVATVCTSNTSWDPNADEGRRMNPGKACIACHEQREGESIVRIGGTVYPTLHEPDLCFGADTREARVIITQADDSEISLSLTNTGNFSISVEDQAELLFPIRARVEYQGRTRVMNTPQDSADCNGCHTERGNNGAPGRITLP